MSATGRDARSHQSRRSHSRLAQCTCHGGKAATYPLLGDELWALRELKRQCSLASPLVFASERGGPFPVGLRQTPRLPETKPRLASGSTRTCSGMPAARRSPIKASGPEFRRCGSNAPQATQQMNRPLFDPEHLRIAAEVRAKAWRRRWLNVAGGLLLPDCDVMDGARSRQ